MSQPSSFDLAARVAAAEFDGEVCAWLSRGFQNWIDNEAGYSLHVALRLPNSPEGFGRLQRDLHLKVAAAILRRECVDATPAALLRELHTFIVRGEWARNRWSARRDPPGGTDELRRALFYVARATDGHVPSLKTIERVVGQIFRQICPTT